MKRLLFAALLAFATAATAAEVSGVKIDDTAKVGGADLVLNGAGKRTRLMFDVYVAALYLPEKKAGAADVLGGAGPKRVSMTLMRDVTPDQLVEALLEGIRLNSTPAGAWLPNVQLWPAAPPAARSNAPASMARHIRRDSAVVAWRIGAN